jgi:hypothetical protein
MIAGGDNRRVELHGLRDDVVEVIKRWLLPYLSWTF